MAAGFMASKIFPAIARKPPIFPASPSNYRARRCGLRAICAHPADRGGDHPSRLARTGKDPRPGGNGDRRSRRAAFRSMARARSRGLASIPRRRFPSLLACPGARSAPGGESFLAVIERVSRALNRLVETYIAVAHGGTIRAALALALDLAPEAALAFTIENCSVTRIDHIDGPGMGHGWRVVTVNRPPR